MVSAIPQAFITLKSPGVEMQLFDEHFLYNKNKESYDAQRLLELIEQLQKAKKTSAASNFAILTAYTIGCKQPQQGELKKQIAFVQVLSRVAKVLLIASFFLPALGVW